MNDRLKWKKLERDAVGDIWVIGVTHPAVATTVIFNNHPKLLHATGAAEVFESSCIYASMEILPHMM